MTNKTAPNSRRAQNNQPSEGSSDQESFDFEDDFEIELELDSSQDSPSDVLEGDPDQDENSFIGEQTGPKSQSDIQNGTDSASIQVTSNTGKDGPLDAEGLAANTEQTGTSVEESDVLAETKKVSENKKEAKPAPEKADLVQPKLGFEDYFEFKEGELSELEIEANSPLSGRDFTILDEELDLQESLSLESAIEAIIFATDKPIKITEIIDILQGEGDEFSPGESFQKCSRKEVEAAIESLRREYRNRGGGVQLESFPGEGYQFLTVTTASHLMQKMFSKKPRPLSRAALETLAIVAYRQPVTRADIEFVRGVDAGSIIKNLLDRELVYCCGRKEDSGRPMLFATTTEFLKVFRLKSLEDLPPLAAFQPPSEGVSEALDLADKGEQEVDVEGFIGDSSQDATDVSKGLHGLSGEFEEDSGQGLDFELEHSASSMPKKDDISPQAYQIDERDVEGAQIDFEEGEDNVTFSGATHDADTEVPVTNGSELSPTSGGMDQGKPD